MKKRFEFFQQSNGLLCITSFDGQFIDLTSAWEKTLGYTLQELYATPLIDFVHPNDRFSTLQFIKKIQQGEIVPYFKNRYLCKDGRTIWLTWEISYSEKRKEMYGIAHDVTAQINREAFYKQACDMGNIGSWRVDLITQTIEWSEKVYEIHELSPDTELDLEKAINFYAPEHQETLREKINSGIEFGEPWDVELEIITAKGNRKWIRAIGECQKNDGKAVELKGVFQDIDASIKMNNSSQRLSESPVTDSTNHNTNTNELSLDRYREVYENSAELLITYNVTSMKIIECNKTLATKLNYTDKGSLLDRNFYALCTPQNQGKAQKMHQKFMTSGFVKNMQIQLLKRNGQSINALCTMRAVRNKQGDIAFARVYLTDVSELQELQKKLKEKDLLFEVLSEINTDGWWDKDLLDPEHEYYSPGFKKLLGYEDHEVPNVSSWWQDNIFESDKTLSFETFQQHVEDGTPYNIPVRYHHKDGSTVWVICRAVAIKNDAGQPIRLVGTHTDITSLKQTQADLSRTIEELENYVYMASHDLKAPIRHIASYSGFIREELLDKSNGEQRQWFDFVENATKRMNDLIDGILRYSKISNQILRHEKVNIQKMGNDIKQIFSEQIKIAEASITYKTEHPLYGDAALLSMMLQNLIENALKFRRPNTPLYIDISTHRGEDYTLLKVKDNGIGIPEEHNQKIFDIFKQLHGQKKYKGLGIGLASCKKIIQMHGGSITVQSKPLEGATFLIRLPR